MIFGHFKRHVAIIDRNGREYRVKMLPVSLLDEFNAVVSGAADGKLSDKLPSVRRGLREMALTVCPAELEKEFLRMDYREMAKIITFLFYGEQQPAARREPESDKIPDFHFLAARILANFPGYTLETLMAEPVPVFMKLAEMVARTQADRALNEQLPAIAAALNGGKALSALQAIIGDKHAQPRVKEDYTAEELTQAQANLNKKGKIIKSVKVGDVINN